MTNFSLSLVLGFSLVLFSGNSVLITEGATKDDLNFTLINWDLLSEAFHSESNNIIDKFYICDYRKHNASDIVAVGIIEGFDLKRLNLISETDAIKFNDLQVVFRSVRVDNYCMDGTVAGQINWVYVFYNNNNIFVVTGVPIP